MATPDPILAALVAFESRLVDHLDQRFEGHARGLKLEMNAGFDALHRRLDHLEVEHQMLKASMDRIEQDVALLKTAYGELTARLDDQGQTLEHQRAAIARLEAEVALVKAAVTRLEADAAEDRADRRWLRADVEALRQRVSDLDARVTELEARLPAR